MRRLVAFPAIFVAPTRRTARYLTVNRHAGRGGLPNLIERTTVDPHLPHRTDAWVLVAADDTDGMVVGDATIGTTLTLRLRVYRL